MPDQPVDVIPEGRFFRDPVVSYKNDVTVLPELPPNRLAYGSMQTTSLIPVADIYMAQ
jgi:hypothetical protein